MQTQTVTPKKDGARRGRPKGYMYPTTVRKIAIKTLEQIMRDETASPEARAIAAAKLLEVHP